MLLNCKPLAGARPGAPAMQVRRTCSWRPAALWRPIAVRLRVAARHLLWREYSILKPGASAARTATWLVQSTSPELMQDR